MTQPTARDVRAAKVADVLSRAVRDGEIEASDALRILRHELRRRNTNASFRIERRSSGAQASIDKYPRICPQGTAPQTRYTPTTSTPSRRSS